MAVETLQTPASEAPGAAATAEAVSTPAEEKPAVKNAAISSPAAEEPKKPESAEEPAEGAAEAAEGEKDEEEGVPQSDSFKEETNVVADLEDHQKKALDELKQLVLAALANHEFTKPPTPPAPKEEDKLAEKAEEPAAEAPKAEESAAEVPKSSESPAEVPAKVEEETHEVPAEGEKATPPPPPEEVFLWGVPLLGDEKSDTVLLKFLRARDFKAKDALAMLKEAVAWRKEFGVEGLLKEDLDAPEELAKVVFMQGHGREGHPVCYNMYGEFQDRELYQKVLSDEEKRGNFLRWRIQFLERGIREHLDFGTSGVCSMVQVTDMKNAPGPWKWELRQATKQALVLLQDNYPEFVANQVFINVPWWHLALNRMFSPFLTQRTESKFVFSRPSKSSETLFKYVAPEQVPVQFGGLSKESDEDFSTSDAVTEVTIKPSTKHAIEIPVPEACVLVWELRVLGWDVSCGAEFVPSAEDGYTVIVQKARRFASTDEPFVKNSFKVGEPGKIVLTVDNSTSKKKMLLYRSKAKSAAEFI